MRKMKCSSCKKETKAKYLGSIRGKMLCKRCRSKRRKERREETIDQSGIRKDLRKLDLRISKEYREKYRKQKESKPPKIKGSKEKKEYKSNCCSLTFDEKRGLFGSLIKRGLSKEEARERIMNLQESQNNLKEKLRGQKKTEDEIKIKQQELLEELWNY